MHDIPELDRDGLRRFGLVTGAIVAGLFGVAIPWAFDLGWPMWPWIVAGVLTLWALAAPQSLNPVYRGWMRFGLIINAVMSRVILGFVFYLVVLPIGLFLRARGQDPMARKLEPERDSYRVASKAPEVDKMERPF